MFPMSSTEGGTCLAVPDTCKVPAPPGPPVPTPFPNTSQLAQSDPSSCALKVTVNYMPVVTLATQILMSSGDESGTMGGVVSGVIMGPTQFTKGSAKVTVEGNPVIFQTCQTGQNGTSPNAVGGVHDSPSQTKVFVRM